MNDFINNHFFSKGTSLANLANAVTLMPVILYIYWQDVHYS